MEVRIAARETPEQLLANESWRMSTLHEQKSIDFQTNITNARGHHPSRPPPRVLTAVRRSSYERAMSE